MGAALVAAWVVAVLHLGYLVYATVGGFLALRSRAWLWPHLVSTGWSLLVTLSPLNCPMTALEKWLLLAAGRTPYDGSYTAHYLRDVVYPAQYETAVWLGMIATAVASYAIVVAAARRHSPAVVLSGP